MTLSDTLAALSERATQGEWKTFPSTEPTSIGVADSTPLRDITPLLDPAGRQSYVLQVANAAFIVALVNAYRTGQLVPVPSHDWLSEIICDNLLDPEPEDAERIALAVIAAIKGEAGHG